MKRILSFVLVICILASGVYTTEAFCASSRTDTSGNKSGSAAVSRPERVVIDSVTALDGCVTVSWTNKSPGSFAYQLRVSTSPDFVACDTVDIDDRYASEADLIWLEPLTDYYFKIRAYDTTDGARRYSAWSPVVRIKTCDDTRASARRRNAEKVWAILKIAGMTDEQCAGVLGNLRVESDMDPTAVEGIFTEPYYIGPRKEPLFDGNDITPEMETYTTETLFGTYASIGLGINHPAYMLPDGRFCAGLGLIQFTGDLAQELLTYADENDKNWYDMDLQIAAILYGIEKTKTRFVQFMGDWGNAYTVYGATGSWLGIMEMGAGAPSFTGVAFERRFQHAQEWYDILAPNSAAITKRYRGLGSSAAAMAYRADQ